MVWGSNTPARSSPKCHMSEFGKELVVAMIILLARTNLVTLLLLIALIVYVVLSMPDMGSEPANWMSSM